MTTHIHHPDIAKYGLHLGCPRCQEHAARPWESMDRENLARIASGDLHTSLDRQAHQALIEHFGHDLEAVLQWAGELISADE